MKIALDYDGTYDSDPELWEKFITLAKGRGHEVKIVTLRDDGLRMPVTSVPVMYSIGRKRECWDADVWIDDHPENV